MIFWNACHLPAEHLGALALAFVVEQSEDQSFHLRAKFTMVLLLVDAIVILPVKSEIPSHNTPSFSIPANQSTLTVEVTPHALVPPSPDPTGTSVVIIAPVQMPIGTDATPTSTVADVQGSEAILVVANATESSPTPLITTTNLSEMVASPQRPISTDDDPLLASPTSENSQLVQVPANAFCLTPPEPSSSTVNRMPSPCMPIRPDMAPMSMPESSQNAKAVCDRTNTSISSPEPSIFAMQFMAVVVSPPQSPIASLHHPLCSSPSVIDASTVQVISNTAVTAPSPSAASVVMVASPQMPI